MVSRHPGGDETIVSSVGCEPKRRHLRIFFFLSLACFIQELNKCYIEKFPKFVKNNWKKATQNQCLVVRSMTDVTSHNPFHGLGRRFWKLGFGVDVVIGFLRVPGCPSVSGVEPWGTLRISFGKIGEHTVDERNPLL